MSTTTPTFPDSLGSSNKSLLNENASTLAPTLEPFTISPDDDIRNFWIGLALAVGSSFFIGSSFIFQKLGLLRSSKREGNVRAGDGGHKYLMQWRWWVGMVLMGVGEVCNFVAYTFAPATLVTPLGALSVIFSAVLASIFLKERLNLIGKVGCFLCVLGSTVMVLHSPKETEIQNMDELQAKVLEIPILVLVAVMAIAAVTTIIFIAPKYGQDHVIVYVFICSTLGSLTIMGSKGCGVALKETFAGRNEFTHWLTYVMLGVVIVNILFQINFLNKALDTFNTAIVTPTYYVLFTSFVILVSLVLYKEFEKMSIEDIIGDLCGFLTIVSGIFLLNAFKDMRITLKTIPKAKKNVVDGEKRVFKDEVQYSGLARDHTNLLECNEGQSQDDELGLLSDYEPLNYTQEINEPMKYAPDIKDPSIFYNGGYNGYANKAFISSTLDFNDIIKEEPEEGDSDNLFTHF